ncbi:aromatic acid/H+ symport family MFS transporter [Paraburkholderia xenovorans]|uniref:MFS transporter n=1 Tax=Paraburkholderia xenovorans TaxID=36873 RepID=UPI0038B88E66
MAANRSASVNVTELIDRNGVSPFQMMIVALCFLIIAIDGFDTAAIGFIAPAIRSVWHVGAAQFGAVFGAGLAGLTLGALVTGPLADRFGRRRVLLLCVLFFGIASVACAQATSFSDLVVLRFLTGLGLGGAMPNAITLTSEYCPSARRMFIVTTMACGFTLGSALGGFVAAALTTHYGWRSVLLAGGVAPLILLPVFAWLLPESVRYLVTTGKRMQEIARVLARISDRDDISASSFTVSCEAVTGSPVSHLFRPDLLRGTLLLWFTFFMSLLVIYLLSSWLPTLLRSTGATLETAALVTAMFQVGGTIGAISLGWLMDRFNPSYVLALSYLAAAVFIAAIGDLVSTPWLAATTVFCAGFCVSGCQVGVNAFAASFYPTDCRATGVSWANGIGRMGSVVGSLAGGVMLGAGLLFPTLFLIVGVPAAIAGVSMFGLGRWRNRVQIPGEHQEISPSSFSS